LIQTDQTEELISQDKTLLSQNIWMLLGG